MARAAQAVSGPGHPRFFGSAVHPLKASKLRGGPNRHHGWVEGADHVFGVTSLARFHALASSAKGSMESTARMDAIDRTAVAKTLAHEKAGSVEPAFSSRADENLTSAPPGAGLNAQCRG